MYQIGALLSSQPSVSGATALCVGIIRNSSSTGSLVYTEQLLFLMHLANPQRNHTIMFVCFSRMRHHSFFHAWSTSVAWDRCIRLRPVNLVVGILNCVARPAGGQVFLLLFFVVVGSLFSACLYDMIRSFVFSTGDVSSTW